MDSSHPINSYPNVSVLTIAGSDSGGGAGIQADLKTFAAFGVFGTCAITAITAQNPAGVTAVEAVSAQILEQQLFQIDDFFAPEIIKTGLLPSADIIKTVTAFLECRPHIRAVVDPVITATSGAVFLDDKTLTVFKEKLLPRAFLITPNLDEVNALLGYYPKDQENMTAAAEALSKRYNCAALVKGGHLPGDDLVDVLHETTGEQSLLRAQRIHTVNSHGSGCTLASAIAAGLAKGLSLKQATRRAHAYLQKALCCPVQLGDQCFIRHVR